MARSAYSTILAVILSIFSSLSLVACKCYCKRDGLTIDCSATERVCDNASSVDSGAQLCCVVGDVCGKDSICHFAKPIADTSGYYLGGCTDPNYEDPVCQQHCTDAGTSDIVYNSNSQLWSCCGYPNNTVSCQNPRTDTTFQAIALNDFPGTSAASPSSTSTSSSSSSSSTSSFMSSSMPASSATAATAGTASAGGTVIVSQTSSGLSTGAIAGIAVAAVLIGLAIIAGLAFLFIRRKKHAAAEADAAAAANMPGYFDTPRHSGTSPPFNVGGMSEIYTPNKDLKVTTNGFYNHGKPNALHESDCRAVPAQLYGSEPPVQELP